MACCRRRSSSVDWGLAKYACAGFRRRRLPLSKLMVGLHAREMVSLLCVRAARLLRSERSSTLRVGIPSRREAGAAQSGSVPETLERAIYYFAIWSVWQGPFVWPKFSIDFFAKLRFKSAKSKKGLCLRRYTRKNVSFMRVCRGILKTAPRLACHILAIPSGRRRRRRRLDSLVIVSTRLSLPW
jgi:hypothetical protein